MLLNCIDHLLPRINIISVQCTVYTLHCNGEEIKTNFQKESFILFLASLSSLHERELIEVGVEQLLQILGKEETA